MSDMLEAIKPWQTLIGGLIAIVAALIAVWNTTRTLRNAKTLELFRRSKKHAALRAVLPLALSELSDYAESAMDMLAELYGKCEDGALSYDKVATPVEFPRVPTDVVDSFSDFIELSDDLDTTLIALLLRRIQVHRARLGSLAHNIEHERDGFTIQYYIETLILNSATLYACASACFDYGRGKTDTLPLDVSWDNVRSALNVMGYRDFDMQSLHEHVSALENAGAIPD